jgi:hypothetical protein
MYARGKQSGGQDGIQCHLLGVENRPRRNNLLDKYGLQAHKRWY